MASGSCNYVSNQVSYSNKKISKKQYLYICKGTETNYLVSFLKIWIDNPGLRHMRNASLLAEKDQDELKENVTAERLKIEWKITFKNL